MKSDQTDPSTRASTGESADKQRFAESVEQAIQTTLRTTQTAHLSCPRPLAELVEQLTGDLQIRANDILSAVQRLEAQRSVVVISTAVGWSVRLASRTEDTSSGTASSESPWTLIHEQLHQMRTGNGASRPEAPDRRGETSSRNR